MLYLNLDGLLYTPENSNIWRAGFSMENFLS